MTNANDLFAGSIRHSSESMGVKITMNSIPSDTAFGDDEVNTDYKSFLDYKYGVLVYRKRGLPSGFSEIWDRG